MKIILIISGVLLISIIIFQLYILMITKKTETQPYKVIWKEDEFEIRYYPIALMARVTLTSVSYSDLGYSGFEKLSKYIFGDNSEKRKIDMTSPVHMEMGDSVSTMAFVMPANVKKEDLPKPDNLEIQIQESESEYVAALKFGGFATTSSINKHKEELAKVLQEKGVTYYGNFRFLGYNPPYQIFGRRNEVIVAININKIRSIGSGF